MDKWCVLAAQAITEKWSVGEFSRYCDDAPDFDSAESSDVATVIWEEYQKAIAAQKAAEAGQNGLTTPAGVPETQSAVE